MKQPPQITASAGGTAEKNKLIYTDELSSLFDEFETLIRMFMKKNKYNGLLYTFVDLIALKTKWLNIHGDGVTEIKQMPMWKPLQLETVIEKEINPIEKHLPPIPPEELSDDEAIVQYCRKITGLNL